MQNLLSKLDPFLKLFLFLSIVGLAYLNFSLFGRVEKIENNLKSSPINRLINLQKPVEPDKEADVPITIIEECGADCQEKIKEEVSKAIAALGSETPTPTPTKAAAAAAPAQTKPTVKQTTYIPLSASYSTTTTSWEDVSSASAWVDLKNDYGNGAAVSFDASIRTESGSGKVFARLFDTTNSIAVLGSELESTKGTSTLVSSGNLVFWAGRNLYRVQIKSLDSSRVYIDGARIKITY